jgi:hypothetical protein
MSDSLSAWRIRLRSMTSQSRPAPRPAVPRSPHRCLPWPLRKQSSSCRPQTPAPRPQPRPARASSLRTAPIRRHSDQWSGHGRQDRARRVSSAPPLLWPPTSTRPRSPPAASETPARTTSLQGEPDGYNPPHRGLRTNRTPPHTRHLRGAIEPAVNQPGGPARTIRRPADQWATDTQPVNPHIHIAAGQAKIPFLLALPAGATRRSRLRFA